jgi:hypothetical protein
MNPVTAQAVAAQRTNDMRANAATQMRARIALRSRGGVRTSRRRHLVPGLLSRLGRGGSSLTSAASQP